MPVENILRQFQDTAERRGNEPCLKFKKGGRWRSLSWTESLQQVQQLSESLKSLGIEPGDRVAILSATRYEWTLLDMAILSLGAVTVPIYQSTLADEAEHILRDSGARIVFVEDSSQLEKVLRVRGHLSALEKIILIQGKVLGDGILTLDEFKGLSAGIAGDFVSRIRDIRLKDLATLVYTSGTTGPPKGVMLSHKNIAHEIQGLKIAFTLDPEECALLFLPLAHIFARIMQFYHLATGFTHVYAESIDKLLDNIKEIRPHFMVSVPRIFEKIYTKVMNDVEAGSLLKRNIFDWAQSVGKEHSEHALNGQPASLSLRDKCRAARRSRDP